MSVLWDLYPRWNGTECSVRLLIKKLPIWLTTRFFETIRYSHRRWQQQRQRQQLGLAHVNLSLSVWNCLSVANTHIHKRRCMHGCIHSQHSAQLHAPQHNPMSHHPSINPTNERCEYSLAFLHGWMHGWTGLDCHCQAQVGLEISFEISFEILDCPMCVWARLSFFTYLWFSWFQSTWTGYEFEYGAPFLLNTGMRWMVARCCVPVLEEPVEFYRALLDGAGRTNPQPHTSRQ